MKLRIKILTGFSILAFMLLISGLWSIHEMNSISSSTKKILDENYQSIYAAKEMKEALEREDSGILLLLLGKEKEGKTIINTADSLFEERLKFTYTNITIPGEQIHLDSIQSKYHFYKNLWVRQVTDTSEENNLELYFQKIHQSFLTVKEAINDLIDLNDKLMYQTSFEIENRSERAIIPGIIAILSALIFTFIFNYLVSYFMVSSIRKITEGINNFKENRTPFDVKIEKTKDEIYYLADAIRNLCESLSTKDIQK
jgi:hypothetical protein